MSILHGSLWTRKIRFRITLMLFSLNLWLNQIGDILLENYKSAIEAKNTAVTAYVGMKNFITESALWGRIFKNSTEEISTFDPYMILYYVLIAVSIFFWLQILYALLFAIMDYRNSAEVGRKKRKKIIYFSIFIINIGIYVFLIKEIYYPL